MSGNPYLGPLRPKIRDIEDRNSDFGNFDRISVLNTAILSSGLVDPLGPPQVGEEVLREPWAPEGLGLRGSGPGDGFLR